MSGCNENRDIKEVQKACAENDCDLLVKIYKPRDTPFFSDGVITPMMIAVMSENLDAIKSLTYGYVNDDWTGEELRFMLINYDKYDENKNNIIMHLMGFFPESGGSLVNMIKMLFINLNNDDQLYPNDVAQRIILKYIKEIGSKYIINNALNQALNEWEIENFHRKIVIDYDFVHDIYNKVKY